MGPGGIFWLVGDCHGSDGFHISQTLCVYFGNGIIWLRIWSRIFADTPIVQPCADLVRQLLPNWVPSGLLKENVGAMSN